jgi:hypothetical protein
MASVFFRTSRLVSAGATIQEAARNAEEALSHIAVGVQHGDHFAAPSDLDDLARDPECDEVSRLLVRAELPGKAVRINITLDESLVAAIDKVAKNRSGFLADAARESLARRRELEAA